MGGKRRKTEDFCGRKKSFEEEKKTGGNIWTSKTKYFFWRRKEKYSVVGDKKNGEGKYLEREIFDLQRRRTDKKEKPDIIWRRKVKGDADQPTN